MSRHAAPRRFHALSRREKALSLGLIASLLLGFGGAAYAAVAGSYTHQCLVADKANGGINIDCDPIAAGTPTPTPSATQAASPSPSPTVPPSPTVAPTTTTAAPTTPPASPTPSPSTSTPTPSPTQTGCMPRPSACGWPDATNTGVPAGTALTVHQGDRTVNVAGTVIDGLDIRGCLIINANNVTIRNSRIGAGGDCEHYVVRSFNRSGVVIEDVEIVLTGWETKGIAFDGYTARRVWFHGGSDCAHTGTNVVIVDSFCDIPAGGPADGPHFDGFQSDGGRNITLRHNTIRVPYAQTSAILMSTNTSPIRDVSIVDNLMAGGGWTVYCGTSTGGPVLGTLTFSGNVIARTYFPKGGYWGPATECPASGWRWD